MNDLKKLIRDSKKALDLLQKGKEYPTKYIVERFVQASERNPKDILINTMRDVITKQASSKNFFSQKEIGSVYNSLYGFASGGSNFESELGDLTPQTFVRESSQKRDASSSRVDMGGQLMSVHGHNEDISKASKEFEDVFSLNKSASFSTFGSNVGKKAEKFVAAQLKSVSLAPKNVKAVHSNEHFILCKATFATNGFREVSVDVPVKYSGVNASFPDKFIDHSGSLQKISQDNLLIDLKIREKATEKNNSSYYSQMRASDSLSIDKVVVPKSLERYSHFEDFAATANSKFSSEQINFAKGVLVGELSSSGIINPQIKTFASNDKGIIFRASIPTTEGRKEIDVPVEFSNNKPIMPSLFSYAGKEYDFSDYNLSKFADRQNKSSSFSKDIGTLKTASYHELCDLMSSSVVGNDYGTAEDCLSVIQQRFDGTMYKKAFDMYSSSITSFAKTKSSEVLIKQAFDKGDLIRVKTSLEPYSPKFGLPLSKLSFDEDGSLIIKGRKEKLENMKNSEAVGISSYQIKLT